MFIVADLSLFKGDDLEILPFMIWREWGIPPGEHRPVSINGVYHKENFFT